MDFVKIPGTQTLYVRDEAEWLAETVVSLRPPPHKRPLDGLPEFHGWMCTLCPDWSTAFCALNWDFSPHLASHHPQGKRGQNVEPVRMQSFGYGQHALWFAVPSSVWSPLSITFISGALPPPKVDDTPPASLDKDIATLLKEQDEKILGKVDDVQDVAVIDHRTLNAFFREENVHSFITAIPLLERQSMLDCLSTRFPDEKGYSKLPVKTRRLANLIVSSFFEDCNKARTLAPVIRRLLRTNNP